MNEARTMATDLNHIKEGSRLHKAQFRIICRNLGQRYAEKYLSLQGKVWKRVKISHTVTDILEGT